MSNNVEIISKRTKI